MSQDRGAQLDEIGVPPHLEPWPDDDRLDEELLRDGDRRNVVDRYRYWTREAIVDDLDSRRHGFHVAIENWNHDFNIGTVVRNANAFLAARVHIVGRKRWNRRGAMVTDRYQHVDHHEDIDSLLQYATHERLAIVGVDNLPGSIPFETTDLPERSLFLLVRRVPGCPRQLVIQPRWFARSRSSAPPARSTLASPAVSPCIAGSDST